jgi:UDP-2-acetamido-3-amino-2,3-dideoxy-glucuronate N-acetyltransferase
VKIQNNVSLYAGVILEDEVFVGPSAVFTNVINPRGGIERKDQFKTTLVRKGATIGANATIVCGNTIGAYAFVGAGAVVTRDVPAYGLAIGNPARLKGWVSAAGHRLVFDASSRARCPETGEMYCLEHGLVRPENIPTN